MLSVSCQRIIDEHNQNQYTSPFQGVWQGAYSGGSSGSITLKVSKSGSVEVIRTNLSFSETFYGKVYSDGALFGIVSASGFYLYGNLNTPSGTWKQDTNSGNWSVVKQ